MGVLTVYTILDAFKHLSAGKSPFCILPKGWGKRKKKTKKKKDIRNSKQRKRSSVGQGGYVIDGACMNSCSMSHPLQPLLRRIPRCW